MKVIKKLGLLVFAIISFTASAQTDKATTARVIEDKNFSFVATSALPLNVNEMNNILNRMSGFNNGAMIDLTGGSYDLYVTADTIKAYLPFYGRAFNATLNQDENGYKFSSQDFTYQTTKRKKGGWDIKIDTKDVRNNARMNLNVSENGYAVLSVISNNKQTITYNGYIRENKPSKGSSK